MALPALINIKAVIEQRQCTGVWNQKDELPVSILIVQIENPVAVIANVLKVSKALHVMVKSTVCSTILKMN